MYMTYSNTLYKIGLLLIIYLLVRLVFSQIHELYGKEAFSNLTPGEYPLTEDVPLLNGVFPLADSKTLSQNGSSQLKQYTDAVEVGSFDQTTNNTKYQFSPEDGTCAPASFCGAFYKDLPKMPNIVSPMVPVPYGEGARVNYSRNAAYLLQQNNRDNMLY
jgi:hypothetical protein